MYGRSVHWPDKAAECTIRSLESTPIVLESAVVSIQPKHNLPAQTTSFLGRRHDMAEVKRLLETSRLVTLTGTGGVGKTRLALEVAHQLRRKYQDGVWLVPLGEMTEPALTAVAVLDAIGASALDSDPLDALINYLRPRHTLIILDNAEHLIDATAEIANTVLESCGDVYILATSREPLRTTGEHLYPVPPLPLPPSDDLIASSAQGTLSDAVALFQDRAAAVSPGFRITDENRDAIAQLCRQLDALPLAIELAATRIRALPLDVMIAGGDVPYGLLTRGSRTVSERHQTLHAMVDWSYRLCTKDEQALWARLSVFSGSFDIEDATKVCADDDLCGDAFLVALAELVDKSIIAPSDKNRGGRYRVLDTISAYGRVRLRERGEESRFIGRHCDYYTHLAEQFDKNWFGPNQVELISKIHFERANLRKALDYCLAEGGSTRTGLRLSAALCMYWCASVRQREGWHWLTRLLERDSAPTAERAGALWAGAFLATLLGYRESAAEFISECRELARRCDRKDLLAHADYADALAAATLPDPSVGLDRARLAVQEEREMGGSNFYLAMSMVGLGLPLVISGDRATGERLLNECIAMCEAHHERWVRSWAMDLLGLAAWLRGDTADARTFLRDSLRHGSELGDQFGLAVALEFLAWIATTDGHLKHAARLFGASHRLWESQGSYLGSFDSLVEWHHELLERARQGLGTKWFDEGFEAGQRMSPANLVMLALGEGKPKPLKQDRDETSLTKRERQVAEFVAQGMSNKEIAKTLVISVRTVDSHVENTMRKLGFNSRAQIAAWFTEQPHVHESDDDVTRNLGPSAASSS